MSEITCARCSQQRPQLDAPPLRSPLGERIYDQICQVCWQDWLQQQTAIINHYAMDLRDPKARQFLKKQTEEFLFGQTPA